MKNCAVITEYNPFHSGHKYQLDVLNAIGFDNIFCVMSGPFVQAAMPAFCDKALRAECAVLGGASAVIELPAVYATASAQLFAEGGLKIISGIKNITHLAMGAVAKSDEILRIAEIKTKFSDRFSCALKSELERGMSYNAASAVALTQLYGELYPDKPSVSHVFDDANNILCIEYISAIYKHCANIEPVIIMRKGALHNDTFTDGQYVSATAIRAFDDCGNLATMQKYIPFNFDKICHYRNNFAADIKLYKKIALFALKRAQPEEINKLRDCSEGMEYLLKNISHLSDFDEIIENATGKRYSKKRLYRLFLDLLLGIEKELVKKRFCTRLLACKKDFDFTLLPECVKTNNADIKTAAENDSEIRQVLQTDINATALYNTLCNISGDYFNYSLVKI
ncbi:MAG: nucleotidyltransferase family protein [Clostridiales bacterium]|nr:nucleotidyltransferase family protein [Clostridiales bacterium]